VGPRTGLDDVEMRKFLTPTGLELRFCYISRKRKFRVDQTNFGCTDLK
jgi:hypothetical protein